MLKAAMKLSDCCGTAIAIPTPDPTFVIKLAPSLNGVSSEPKSDCEAAGASLGASSWSCSSLDGRGRAA